MTTEEFKEELRKSGDLKQTFANHVEIVIGLISGQITDKYIVSCFKHMNREIERKRKA